MKPRSLMIIHHFRPGQVGGAELQAERLAKKLYKLGHEVQVFTRKTVTDAPVEEEMDGVKVSRSLYPMPYHLMHDTAHTFFHLLRKANSFDIMHSHIAVGHAALATVFAKCFGKKSIIKVACAGQYGDMKALSDQKTASIMLEILHGADVLVAISSEVEKELIQNGFQKDKIVRIPNGVDTEFFTRNETAPQKDKFTFIITGRRHPQKGIDIALKAISILKSKGYADKFIVLMYGIDYEEYNYRKMSVQMQVDEMVRFCNFEKDIKSIYESADCFLLPSRGEGLSNALLESMSMKLPVIATSVSGTVDVIDDGVDGIIIPPEDPESLAAAMEKIIANPGFAAKLGQNARKKVEEKFSISIIAEKYSELYSKIYAEPVYHMPNFFLRMFNKMLAIISLRLSGMKYFLKKENSSISEIWEILFYFFLIITFYSSKKSMKMNKEEFVKIVPRKLKTSPALIQNYFATALNSLPVNFQIPKPQLNKIQKDVKYAVQVANVFMFRLKELDLDIKGKRVLELGPGINFGSTLLFACYGAEKIIVADRFIAPWNKEYHPVFYKTLLNYIKENMPELNPGPIEKVIKYNGYPSNVIQCIPSALETLVEIPDASVDIIISNAVLEHIYDPEAAVKTLARISNSGAFHFHQVDFAYHTKRKSPLDFLLTEDKTFEKEFNSCNGECGNRVRPCEYDAIFRRHGLDVLNFHSSLQTSPEYLSSFVPKLKKALGSKYINTNPIDLVDISGLFVLKNKPAQNIIFDKKSNTNQ